MKNCFIRNKLDSRLRGNDGREQEVAIFNWKDLKTRLAKSKFRNSFKLKKKDREYIDKKGLPEIEKHAEIFIRERLAPKDLKNDGKQTPMRGHSVFIGQHATATCCRGCLSKWHQIPVDQELQEAEISYIINIIMAWIKEEYEKK